MNHLNVNQTGYSPYPHRMIQPMVTVRLGKRLIMTEAIDTVFDNNAELSKSTIVAAVCFRLRLGTWFLAWTVAQGMAFANALIAQVASAAHSWWQTVKQPRLVKEFDV